MICGGQGGDGCCLVTRGFCVYVYVGVGVGFLTGFERMFDDFEDLGMVLNFRKNDLILKTKCMERNWRRVNQRWISEWNLFFFQFQV